MPGVTADMPGVNAEKNNWHNCLEQMPDANAWKNAWNLASLLLILVFLNAAFAVLLAS